MKNFLPKTFLFTLSFVISSYCFAQIEYNWTQVLGGTFNEISFDGAVDSKGKFHQLGTYFSPALPIATSPPIILGNQGAEDIISIAYNLEAEISHISFFGGKFGDFGTAIHIDDLDNQIFTGSFADTIGLKIDGEPITTLEANGKSDVFIIKLDSNGDFRWAKTIGGPDSDAGIKLASDQEGTVFLSGVFTGSVDFDPDSATSDIKSPSVGNTGQFIAKFASDGSYISTKILSNGDPVAAPLQNAISDLKIGLDNTLLVAGSFTNQLDLDLSDNEHLITAVAEEDAYIVNYTADLESINWVYSFGGDGQDRIKKIEVDPFGNILVTGTYEGTVDFAPGADLEEHTSKGGIDIFLLKLDRDGNLLWVNSFGGTPNGTDLVDALVLDDAGNSYIGGRFSEFIQLDPANIQPSLTAELGNNFFARYDKNGNFDFLKSFEVSYISEMALYKDEHLFITGGFSNTANFNPPETFLTLSAGSGDFFTSKYTIEMPPTSSSSPVNSEPFKIYPNPTSGDIHFFLSGSPEEKIQIDIYDFTGRLVYTTMHLWNTPLNIQHLPKGIYVIAINNRKSRVSQKISLH